eukprot:m.96201 g.96201  ORF g.96201 m.96201 type:complete len:337 (-) comp8786_c0_seq3:1149-2159(-)
MLENNPMMQNYWTRRRLRLARTAGTAAGAAAAGAAAAAAGAACICACACATTPAAAATAAAAGAPNIAGAGCAGAAGTLIARRSAAATILSPSVAPSSARASLRAASAAIASRVSGLSHNEHFLHLVPGRQAATLSAKRASEQSGQLVETRTVLSGIAGVVAKMVISGNCLATHVALECATATRHLIATVNLIERCAALVAIPQHCHGHALLNEAALVGILLALNLLTFLAKVLLIPVFLTEQAGLGEATWVSAKQHLIVGIICHSGVVAIWFGAADQIVQAHKVLFLQSIVQIFPKLGRECMAELIGAIWRLASRRVHTDELGKRASKRDLLHKT